MHGLETASTGDLSQNKNTASSPADIGVCLSARNSTPSDIHPHIVCIVHVELVRVDLTLPLDGAADDWDDTGSLPGAIRLGYTLEMNRGLVGR
jgi:hypothetical protein